MKAVFIDTFYDKSSQKETEKFEEYTNQLISFANSVHYFECKDIKTALTELMRAKQEIDNLVNQTNNLMNQISQLQTCQNKLQICQANKENSPKKVAGWGNGFVALIGILCLIFGLLISTVYTKYKQHTGKYQF